MRTDLAIYVTKLANQRTYLAYMRTGFGIASIAGTFKRGWIFTFGILMILVSSLQYIMLNYKLDNEMYIDIKLDMLPLLYIFLSLGALYLEFYKK